MNRVDFIQPILKMVGKIINTNSQMDSNFSFDKGYKSLIDLQAHDIIKNEIISNFPDDQVFSEEAKIPNNMILKKDKFYWVTDPLCGTTNYLHGIPFYSTSLTLLQNETILASGVFDPLRKEMFFSTRTNFFYNKKKYILNKKTKLCDSLICINSNQSNWSNKNLNIETLVDSLSPPVSRRIHILESANLELAYVACGKIDAYVNPTDKIWDIIAATNHIPNAGGFFEILEKNDKNYLNKRGIIAGNNKELVEEIKSKIKKIF